MELGRYQTFNGIELVCGIEADCVCGDRCGVQLCGCCHKNVPLFRRSAGAAMNVQWHLRRVDVAVNGLPHFKASNCYAPVQVDSQVDEWLRPGEPARCPLQYVISYSLTVSV